MTTTAGTRFASGTLSASVVDTIILTHPCHIVTVVNTSGTAQIWFRVSDGQGGPNAQPTIGGGFTLPAAIGSVDIRGGNVGGVVVNLISSGTPTYTVEIAN